MTKINLYDVFTPSVPNDKCFVEREYLNRQFDKALKSVGTQIIVFGNSGAGKTTFVLNKYKLVKKNYIKYVCSKTTTYDELIDDAYCQLNEFYDTEKTSEVSKGLETELSGNLFQIIIAKIKAGFTRKKGIKSQRVVPFQKNERNLADKLNANNCIWIIEDFHKVSLIEKNKLSDNLKAFNDLKATIPQVRSLN